VPKGIDSGLIYVTIEHIFEHLILPLITNFPLHYMRLKNFSLPVGTQIFKSLSDESRVRILNLLLAKKEICITDVEQLLEFTQTKSSRHLTYLKNSGMLSTEKKDQWVFYSIKDEVHDIVSQMLSFLNRDATLQKDIATFETLDSNRELAKNKFDKRHWMG